MAENDLKIDKKKFVSDLEKDFNIQHFDEDKYKSEFNFDGLEETFAKSFNSSKCQYNKENDIKLNIEITKQEAKAGVEKEICYTKNTNGCIKEKCNIKIKIPTNIQNNQMILLRGEGNISNNGNVKGNLYITVKISLK